MNRILLTLLLVICHELHIKAQELNPWLDSTQINKSALPIYVANGVIINPSEINIDFILSVEVVRDNQTNRWLGKLAKNGCVYIKADQQFDIITPKMYRLKKNIPDQATAVFYMLNGHFVSDSLKLSKASIRKVDVLSGKNYKNIDPEFYCLSIWTLTSEERGLPKDKNTIRIRGFQE
ncbi:hypothetical protein [Spirosoma foliorum]|uniref:Uncharacterized protein n=1 Tax=Spirosoma foliorum TaxID=2710596 RepID=A0A7G5GXA4_9BACT|nr:hypothetical protein [Spirosoma foliorum]QMW03496.1 hypothetical protein H3H32_00555 [Spirosoma foliorum]